MVNADFALIYHYVGPDNRSRRVPFYCHRRALASESCFFQGKFEAEDRDNRVSS